MSRALRWEYDRREIDISTMSDPPNSREPVVVYFRRPVGEWEPWEPTPGETAPVWVEGGTDE